MKDLLVLLRSNPDRWTHLLQAALPDHRVLTEADAAAPGAAYAIVTRPAPGVLAGLAKLEVVFSINAGIEPLLEGGEVPAHLPIVRMVDHGLSAGMLEWVLAQTLAWHRNLFDYRALQVAGEWRPLGEKLASECRVTVLGAGSLGGPVVTLLAQLGFQTRAWSRTPKRLPGVASFHGADGLAPAVEGTDILINLLPLTPETEDLIDGALLARMAMASVLINAGRGRHVVDRAVIAALDAGRLRAAVLDVFRDEPLPAADPFWRHPGVYLSPHVAAPTHADTAVAAIADNIRRHEAGGALLNLVDRARGY
jgi:glyoxylate/hydroxypyruvate reductase